MFILLHMPLQGFRQIFKKIRKQKKKQWTEGSMICFVLLTRTVTPNCCLSTYKIKNKMLLLKFSSGDVSEVIIRSGSLRRHLE